MVDLRNRAFVVASQDQDWRQRVSVDGLAAILLAVVVVLAVAPMVRAATPPSKSTWRGTLEERVAAQRALEQVYWKHRIWPAASANDKPDLDASVPPGALRSKVEDALLRVKALEVLFGTAISDRQVSEEIDRMARSSKMPDRLTEIWDALEDNPVEIAEMLVKPLLADRLLREKYSGDRPFDQWWADARTTIPLDATSTSYISELPSLQTTSCTTDTWSPMDPDLPVPRTQHSAVWTGTEMIIWGGLESSVLNEGNRYDPATDTWTPISRVGAPYPPYPHTAVWTGSEMIIWAPPDPGARYNPATDQWTPIETNGAPEVLTGSTAVWTGSKMIVWGGMDIYGEELNTGFAYSPATDSWSAISSSGAPATRQFHSALWTGTRMIVWGGYTYDPDTGSNVPLNSGGVYDPSANHWSATKLSGAPSPRLSHSVVWTGTEMIVWGGDDVADPLDSGARYKLSNNSWTALPTLGAPSARMNHVAVWSGTEMIVWGGTDGPSALGNGARYQPSTNTWILLSGSGAPTGRFEHTAVWTGTEMIVWGGRDLLDATDTGGRYRPSDNTWTSTRHSHRPKAREGHATVWTGSEMLMWGGTNSDGGVHVAGARYDPALDDWASISTLGEPIQRRWHTAIWTGTEMIVWGGEGWDAVNFAFYPIQTGGRYNPALDSWIPTPSSGEPSARDWHSAVWTGQEMIVWGGHSAQGGELSSGGRYTPGQNSWVPTTLVGAPSPRSHHVGLWTGREMIVWGGAPFPLGSTGGRYDPATGSWKPMSTTGAPTHNINFVGVWSGNEAVLLTNREDLGQPDEGGRYDPSRDSWLPTSTNGAPSFHQSPAEWLCGGMFVRGISEVYRLEYLKRYDPAGDSWTSREPSGALVARTSSSSLVADNLMIWWGGSNGALPTNTGAVYCGCSALPPLGVVNHVKVSKVSGVPRLAWGLLPGASGYDVVRGRLATLRATDGDFAASTEACLANDTTLSWLEDPSPTPPGGLWYLVRGISGSGHGSYDSGVSSQVGSRDAEIAASGHDCP